MKKKPKLPYVSRGGLKLAQALSDFEIVVKDLICADVGASTGGFTDVLLQQGAQKVYAIDVAYGEFAWKLRNDPRVVVMERTNARLLEALPEKINFSCIDVSFISLKLVLPRVFDWLQKGTESKVVCLVKPQFEAKKEEVPRGGIIKDPEVQERVLGEIKIFGEQLGFQYLNSTPATTQGAKGNQEFLLAFQLP